MSSSSLPATTAVAVAAALQDLTHIATSISAQLAQLDGVSRDPNWSHVWNSSLIKFNEKFLTLIAPVSRGRSDDGIG